jgi:hypothetical protein
MLLIFLIRVQKSFIGTKKEGLILKFGKREVQV